jgi:hypothetical protein
MRIHTHLYAALNIRHLRDLTDEFIRWDGEMFLLEKQPSEVVPCAIDFSDVLPTGETADSASTVTAKDSTGVDVSASLLTGKAATGSVVSITVKSGSAGDYRLTFLIVTTPSVFKFEEDVLVRVKEN